jgi:membrane protein YdbS with pleckstrin-like domain
MPNLDRVDELFAPPGESWQRVSPRLCSLYRTIVVALTSVAALVLVAVSVLWLDTLVPAVVVVALAMVAAGVGWVAAARRQRSWGYAERDADLFITSGVLFRELIAVPYGRMQFIDVTAGPLDRYFGITTVRLHTATPQTHARIPGIVPEEAARLRDRLTSLGEAWAAGL